ncbi:MAG: ATP-grasp domain-containing protein [SAR324 cluster bacterium]|nr:ATP-grasp domain-containing protein [SAR324 cluster bacterium]
MSRILLLIPTTTYRAAAFMEAAQRLQLEVVVGSDQRQVFSAMHPERSLALDFQNPDRAVRQIADASNAKPFQAIVGVDDETVILAAMANEALGIKHNSVESVRATRDKFLFREKLQISNLVSPHFELFSIETPVEQLSQRINFPSVLKPTFLSGSRGVIRADNAKEFADAFVQIRGILADPEILRKGGDSAHHILVEDYIPGKEVALEGLLCEGELKLLALFDKPDPLEGPLFVETIYVTPSRLPENIQDEIIYVTQQAARGLGLHEGPIHAELRCNDRGIWPIEIAARSIGGLCSRVLEFSSGHSLEELILLHALGNEIQSGNRKKEAAGVMMIPVLKQGILKGVSGKEQAMKITGINELLISIPLNQEIEPLPRGDRYLGFIFAQGESPGLVEQALREAYQCLEFEVTGE